MVITLNKCYWAALNAAVLTVSDALIKMGLLTMEDKYLEVNSESYSSVTPSTLSANRERPRERSPCVFAQTQTLFYTWSGSARSIIIYLH